MFGELKNSHKHTLPCVNDGNNEILNELLQVRTQNINFAAK
jgi:hypothetical protein